MSEKNIGIYRKKTFQDPSDWSATTDDSVRSKLEVFRNNLNEPFFKDDLFMDWEYAILHVLFRALLMITEWIENYFQCLGIYGYTILYSLLCKAKNNIIAKL